MMEEQKAEKELKRKIIEEEQEHKRLLLEAKAREKVPLRGHSRAAVRSTLACRKRRSCESSDERSGS